MAIVSLSIILPIPEYPYITTYGAVNLILSGPSVVWIRVSFALPIKSSDASFTGSCCLSLITECLLFGSPVTPLN